ncbi:hypothetical protein [Streptomyces sp. NPDC088789]|uniref:hypothetical protein n=1 Tax=Streptomyces sp. NPDC088789 TaxID=3365899 RepID=UPI0037F7E59A
MQIGHRFNGPADSANGGYACGLFAQQAKAWAWGDVAVTLHSPPPLDTEITPVDAGARTQFWAGDVLVAVAGAGRAVGRPPAWAPAEVAAAAEQGFRGMAGHLFPTCFVCGTVRQKDGLSLRPGPLLDGSTTACLWKPDDSTGIDEVALLWSVLDCPGGWTVDLAARPMMLSRMSATLLGRARSGERYVVRGDCVRQETNALATVTAVYHEDGMLIAWASAWWTAFRSAADSLV